MSAGVCSNGAALEVAFFDVDGTLVYRDPSSGPGVLPTSRVIEAVRAFAARGGVPVLSTGRSRAGIGELLKLLPFGGYVSMDGAHVVLDGRVVVDRCFPRGLLERMVAEMLRVGMPAFFEGTELCLELNGGGESLYNWGPVARSLDEMRAAKPDLRFGKIDFVDAAMEAYRSSAFLTEELEYYNVGDGCHELVMRGVSKGAGARALVEALVEERGAGDVRTYAFGDSENDLSLFEAVDVAVAMGQADERVRAAADVVAPACAADGVAIAMENLGLI